MKWLALLFAMVLAGAAGLAAGYQLLFEESFDRGVAHRIRTSVSGIHHELVLVHPDARRDVVMVLDGMDPTMTPAAMLARLGLPEITSGELARRR